MGRRKKGQNISGWVALDKPAGLTSTQALGKLRRLLDANKAGHAGTLDPLATGILPIAFGEATKTIPFCQDFTKVYEFTVTWGEERDTDDAEGQIINTSDTRPQEKDIISVLKDFKGEISQLPPLFSAIKINGARAYDMARAGETPDLKPRPVYIEALTLLETETDKAHFECVCGKGTYIRSIARDMGRMLGTYGYVSALKRTEVGPFQIEDAVSLANLEEISHSARLESAVLPVQTVLDDIPALAVSEEEAGRLRRGQSLQFFSRPHAARLQQLGAELEHTGSLQAQALLKGDLVALIELDGVEVKPARVFNL